jgi:protein SCO1/2
MDRRGIVVALIAALAAACNGGDAPSPAKRAPVEAATRLNGTNAPNTTLPPSDWSASLSNGSVYDLPAVVTDQDGNAASIDLFRGHPVLITMFYSTCPNACPLLTADIKRIDRQLPQSVRDKLRVLMVSFDAARDTPDLLSKYGRERGLDGARWKLASATEDTARELAALLGIRYRKLDNGAYYHTSAIILLDEQGHPKARVEGLGKDPAPILDALGAAGS